MGDKIVCQICQRQFNKITGKHILSHGITFAQYVEQYPLSPLISEQSLIKKKQSAIIANAQRKGQPRSQLVKDKISATKSANPQVPWNKGQQMSQEYKSTLSTVKKLAYQTGTTTHWNIGKSTPTEVKHRISKTLLDIHQDNRHKKKLVKQEMMDQIQITILNLHTELPACAAKFNIPTQNTIRRLQSIQQHQSQCRTNNLSIIDIRGDVAPIVYQISCDICDNTFLITNQYFRSSKLNSRNIGFCPTCNPRERNTSIGEIELFEFVNQYFSDAIHNDRAQLDGFELDVFIPSINTAIEYTGNYWHSEDVHNDKYNLLTKHQMCEQRGIRLITIFEDEWRDKQGICKNRIINKLSMQPSKLIHARKCVIVPVSHTETTEFLNNFHIQSGDRAHIRYGAKFEDQLIAVMTFKPTNYIKGGNGESVELSRYAIAPGIQSTGLAAKLFRAFVRSHSPSQIVSYSDRRWNTGKLYETLGFECGGITPPSFWYVPPGSYQRKHRSTLMKHKLVEMGHDPELTAKQITTILGYNRIWDCGNTKWIWTNSNK